MITIIPFKETHLNELAKLETECFSIPWSKEMFEQELKSKLAHYFVALENEKVIGYAGMWEILDEGHITNIAVSPLHRNVGIGQALLNKLKEIASEFELSVMLLEVRRSNNAAIGLYSKNGFIVVGQRKGYYHDNNEDALLMNLTL